MKSLSLPEDTLRPYPVLPPLYFFLATSFPLGMLFFHHWGGKESVCYMVSFLIVGWILTPISLRKWSWMAILGILLTVLTGQGSGKNYRNLLPRKEVYTELQGIVTELHQLESDFLLDIGKNRNIEITVKQIRFSSLQNWQPCNGRILLRYPDEDCRYGVAIHAQGALYLPKNSTIGGFDYRSYLQARGIYHLLDAEEIHILDQQPQGWRKLVFSFLQLREDTLERMLRFIEGEKNRNLIAAMTFGLRYGLDTEDKQVFVKSGMMHLLAVSGLHVGIVYTIFSFFLQGIRIPFVTRQFILPILLLVYVASTGMAPSAIRAWLMISFWSIAQGLRLPSVPVNTVLAAGFLLLLVNPFYIFQSGFQFSFLVVLALISGCKKGLMFFRYLNEKQYWIPSSMRKRNIFSHLVTQSVYLLLGGTCAMLGSLGLTAYHNQLILPISIFTNVLACTVSWFVLFFAIIKVLLSYISSHLELFIATPLCWILDFLYFLAEISATYSWIVPVPQPSVKVVVGYYAILFLLFFSGKKIASFLGLGFFLLGYIVFGVASAYPPQNHRCYILLPEGRIVPIIVIFSPETPKEATVFNTGPRSFGMDLSRWLRRQGITTIKECILLDNRVDFVGGLETLAAQFPIRTILVQAQDYRGVKKIRNIQWDNGSRWRLFYRENPIYFMKYEIAKSRLDATRLYEVSWDNRFHLRIQIDQGQESNVCITTSKSLQHKKTSWKFLYRNKINVVVIEF